MSHDLISLIINCSYLFNSYSPGMLLRDLMGYIFDTLIGHFLERNTDQCLH